MIVTKDKVSVGTWNTIQRGGGDSDTAELLILARPHHDISVSPDGDDTLGVRMVLRLDMLDDLRATIEAYLKIPEVESELTWIQEGDR